MMIRRTETPIVAGKPLNHSSTPVLWTWIFSTRESIGTPIMAAVAKITKNNVNKFIPHKFFIIFFILEKAQWKDSGLPYQARGLL